MEPAGSPPGMSCPKNLRPKQREIIQAFATKVELTAKLPTGYGKTLAAAGAYAALKHRGVANRVLYIVPRSGQAAQAAEELPSAMMQFGLDYKTSIQVGQDPIAAKKSHVMNTREVFVVTVQSLLSRATWSAVAEMMRTGQWFVVVDEHHHYGKEGAWSEKIKGLNRRAMLAMSATPARLDERDHFPDPEITETYLNAAKQGIVKMLRLHAYDYIVDAITVDGVPVPYTTEELVKEVGSDSPEAIDKHLIARKMRWSPKYLSPLVAFPLDRVIDLRMRGVKAQMLVQAMSCSHAEMVCEQIKALIPSNMSVDWVGTGPRGRHDRENHEVLHRFCPEKDRVTGRREWSLDILVNVGIASEGMDTTDVTEIVFLTPANITTTNLQTIGRGARIIPGLKDKQPDCHVNVDTGSEMAKHLGTKVMALFDVVSEDDDNGDNEEEDTKTPNDDDPPDDYNPLPDDMQVVIVDVHLQDIRTGEMWKAISEKTRADQRRDWPNVPESVIIETADRSAEKALRDYLNRSNNATVTLAQKRDMVDHAASKLAGLVQRRVMSSGHRPDKSFIGDVRKRINSEKKKRFGSVREVEDEALEQHYRWIKSVETSILAAEGMEGIPRWLR